MVEEAESTGEFRGSTMEIGGQQCKQIMTVARRKRLAVHWRGAGVVGVLRWRWGEKEPREMRVEPNGAANGIGAWTTTTGSG